MIHIIDAREKDIPLINDLAIKTWPSTFKNILCKEQITYMLEWMYSYSSLSKQMQKGHHFLLVKAADQNCGYCSYVNKTKKTILQKIYILPESQGLGIGKSLLKEVILRARQSGKKTLQLNVNRYNKAVNFYQKQGFKIISTEDNPIGQGYYMNDFVMELPLS